MINQEKLDILIVEHSGTNADVILRTLTQSDFQIGLVCISTIESLDNDLQSNAWDVILSNYDSSRFDEKEMFRTIASQMPNVPLIVISSNVSEDAVEDLMEWGVDDFMMITNLARLVPVIKRGLREQAHARRYHEMEVALQKSDDLFQGITSNLPGVVFQFFLADDGQVSYPFVSDATETLLGLSPRKLMDKPQLFPELILPEDRDAYYRLMMTSAEQLATWNWEGCIQVKGDSDIKWISLRATPRKTDIGVLWNGIMINITRNKLAEREIAHSREQLAELSSYLQKIKEQERARIAREIHDDIGGTLTAIKCELFPCIDGAVRAPEFYQLKAKSVESLVDRVIDSTRRISLDLRPGILDCGIVAAVQWQAKEFSDRTGIACKVASRDDEISLDSDLSIAIFRIFQETLTNISKHAHASRIEVKLAEVDGVMLLEVIDNGRGINLSDMEKENSFGIRGMRERCQQLKGNFQIIGEPGKGTKVIILMPISNLSHQSVVFSDIRVKKDKFPQAVLMKSDKKASRR